MDLIVVVVIRLIYSMLRNISAMMSPLNRWLNDDSSDDFYFEWEHWPLISLCWLLVGTCATLCCASWPIKLTEERTRTIQDHAANAYHRLCRIFAGSNLLQHYCRKCWHSDELDRLRSAKRDLALGQRNIFSEPVTYRSATDCNKKWLHWSNVYECHRRVSAVLVTREALVQIFRFQDVSVRRAPSNLQHKTKRNFYRILFAPETQSFDPTWHVSV